jgi:hypothetical protein
MNHLLLFCTLLLYGLRAKKFCLIEKIIYSWERFILGINTIVTNIEKVETELTIFNAKRALSNQEKLLESIQIGESLLFKDKVSPQSIYYNRVKGFGPADLNKLDDILEFYQQDQITPSFDMTPNRLNYDVAKALSNKGFFAAEQLAFLHTIPYAEERPNHPFRFVQVTKDFAEQFISLIGKSNGVQYDERLMKQKSSYFFEPNFKNWIAFIEGQPAGMGSLYVSGNQGYLANDYTFPEYRGKGLQTALIHYRLQAAKELKLEQIYTDVEFGSVSHNNMSKAGFKLAFVNSFWMKET